MSRDNDRLSVVIFTAGPLRQVHRTLLRRLCRERALSVRGIVVSRMQAPSPSARERVNALALAMYERLHPPLRADDYAAFERDREWPCHRRPRRRRAAASTCLAAGAHGRGVGGARGQTRFSSHLSCARARHAGEIRSRRARGRGRGSGGARQRRSRSRSQDPTPQSGSRRLGNPSYARCGRRRHLLGAGLPCRARPTTALWLARHRTADGRQERHGPSHAHHRAFSCSTAHAAEAGGDPPGDARAGHAPSPSFTNTRRQPDPQQMACRSKNLSRWPSCAGITRYLPDEAWSGSLGQECEVPRP